MIIVVWLNFFGKKNMSAGLCNLDLKNSYLSRDRYPLSNISWIHTSVESGIIIVVWLNFFGKKTMSAGLCNLDLKNSYLSSMTFSKHLKTS